MGMNVMKDELPPKCVYVISVKLSPLQRQLYIKFLEVHRFKWVVEHRELYLPSSCIQRNQGGSVAQGRTLVLCYTGWCLYDWKLVLEKPRSWCFLLVGARENRELVLPSSWC